MTRLLALLASLLLSMTTPAAPAPSADLPPMTRAEMSALLNEAADDLTSLGLTLNRSEDDAIIDFYLKRSFGRVTKTDMADELLFATGCGQPAYDDVTYAQTAWTPTSHQIYAFDAEVYDIEHMYQWLLLGVESIVPNLHFDNVTEDLSAMVDDSFDYEALYDENGNLRDLTETELAQLFSSMPDSSGSRSVSFTVHNNSYTFIMKDYGDWIDSDIIDRLNAMLQAEGYEYRLHPVNFRYSQIVILYYGPQSSADALSQLLSPW